MRPARRLLYLKSEMRPDIVIVHSSVGGGHKAAAFALAETARARGLEVVVLDTFDHAPRVLGRAYLGAHLTAQAGIPALYGSAYFAANHRDGALEPIRRGIDHVAWAGLVARVVALSPRAVIATHHLPLLVLGRARRKGRLECSLVGVVTDYGTHAVWAEKGVDALCVPPGHAAADAEAHGFAPGRTFVTGIPVRPAFETIARVRDPAPGEPLRVLVTSGGFGVGPIRAVVRSFAGIPDVELTVVCGRAQALARRVSRTAARAGVRACVLGFERDMPARLAEAHVVVGKAGGLTVSETLTAGRPMVVAGLVPGNEAINAALLVRTGAGTVARPRDVGNLVAEIRRLRLVASMGRTARSLVPRGAADRVLAVALAGEAEADAA
jgi:processive 1,2-diacylglycerol beta-glucosyltransferase